MAYRLSKGKSLVHVYNAYDVCERNSSDAKTCDQGEGKGAVAEISCCVYFVYWLVLFCSLKVQLPKGLEDLLGRHVKN